MSIGSRLRAERKRLGYSQQAFAAIAGLSTQAKTQCLYETGKRHPGADYLSRAAGAGADVLYIITGQRTPVRKLRLTNAPVAAAHIRKFLNATVGKELSERDRDVLLDGLYLVINGVAGYDLIEGFRRYAEAEVQAKHYVEQHVKSNAKPARRRGAP